MTTSLFCIVASTLSTARGYGWHTGRTIRRARWLAIVAYRRVNAIASSDHRSSLVSLIRTSMSFRMVLSVLLNPSCDSKTLPQSHVCLSVWT
jgi:hypothetical protein